MKKVLFVMSMLAVSACSIIPEKLQVSENTSLIPFSNVRAMPNENVGQTARWGGVIAKVENKAKQTMIEVVNFDLSSSARPKQKQETQGRFRIYHAGLLDPVIYKVGKSITAIGSVGHLEDGKIGEHEYQYPVLNATNVYLWKDIQKVEVRVLQNSFWHSPSFWHYPPFYHRGQHLIRTRTNNKPTSKVTKKEK
ncbi:MAG: Slp family lipoprotein [Alteromonadaceae bacterium]|nr:Slp family lipoprotein [Alteromonadaceae bacterium]